jgi:CRISPR/Cas system Type II protein with McrA/HNH and RuvC-like nuclease domain
MNVIHNFSSSVADFANGLVFGFDVGTGSIGYAVRKGKDFKDVGVLICPEDTNDLGGRRGLRSQRRRLRNRGRIRDWLANQLEEKLQLPSPWTKTESGQIVLKPGLDHARISNPVLLRCEALEGRLEKPEELHAAITHLWKRRGKTEVPWKQGEAKQETAEQKEEKKKVAIKLNALESEILIGDGTPSKPKPFTYPCQLLLHRQKIGIKQRDEVWPRDEFQNKEFKFNLKNEFLAIIEKATALKNEKGERLPKLSEIKIVFQENDQSRTVS